MTILVVHNRYRFRGGEDSVYESECAMLENAGHRVVRYEKSNADIRERGLLRKIGLAARTVWNPSTVRDIKALIRAEKPDVVHCHNTFPVISPSVYWAAAAEGVPIVQTLHNYRLACLNGYLFRDGAVCEDCLGRAPWRGVCRACYRGSRLQSAAVAAMLLVHRALGTYRRKVSLYVALTDFAKDKFAAAGLPADKIAVKPNALVVSHGGKRVGRSATMESPDGKMDDAFRIVCIGRLSREKGVDVLLRAWAILFGGNKAQNERAGPRQAPGNALTAGSDQAPPASCMIVGDGPERESLERLSASLGISASVRFSGIIPRSEALSELARSNLLVLPSTCYEQFSTTVLEAMRAGIPALVSDCVVNSTLLRDGVTGRFFESGNPDSLANALRELLSDPGTLRKMGKAAREAFETSECVPERNLAKLLEAYRTSRERAAAPAARGESASHAVD